MITEELLFNRYVGKRLLLDSNLLLLYLVGSFQRALVPTFKRTADFTLLEFDLLSNIVSRFSKLLTTPHVLTEVSSLANSLPGHIKSSWLEFFAANIAQFDEVFTAATDICQENAFNPFGLTDAALQNASKNTLMLSEDFRLTGFLLSRGVDTLNFRDLASMLR